jgi:hypothetical protein
VGGSQLGCSPNPSILRHRIEPENSRVLQLLRRGYLKGLGRVARRPRLDSGLISRLSNKQNTIDGRCWWLYKAGYDPTAFVDFFEKIGGYSRGGKYQFGDPTFSQDFRLTKVFNLGEKAKISVLAEMFNAFNIATLTG